MPNDMTKLGGRKFVFCVYCFTLITALAIGHVIDQEAYKYLAGVIFSGYVAANVAQKVFVKPPETGATP